MAEEAADSVPKCIDRAGGGGAQQPFQLAEHELDRVEVRTVGREKEQRRTLRLDRLAHTADFMTAEIISDDNIAWCQGGSEKLLDIGQECRTVDRAIEHQRCDQTVVA